MEKTYKIQVSSRKKENLVQLFKDLFKAFPDIDKKVDYFHITEGKSPFFGAGNQIIENITLHWNIEELDDEKYEFFLKVAELIKESDIGEILVEHD